MTYHVLRDGSYVVADRLRENDTLVPPRPTDGKQYELVNGLWQEKILPVDPQEVIRTEFFKLPGELQDKYEDLIIAGKYYMEHGQMGGVLRKLNTAKGRSKTDPRETAFIEFVENVLSQQ